MFRNSTELLEYALRELQVAIAEERKEVEITLNDAFSGDINEVFKLSRNLEVMAVAELLRKVYNEYYIKSIIGPKVTSEITIKFPQLPAKTYYPIVWKLILQKK